MELTFNDENMLSEEVTEKMEEAAALCLERESVDPDITEISVSFVDKKEIQELNKVYRNNDSVTDVLSFPQYCDDIRNDDIGYLLLGDVVICTDKAREQAEEFGHSFERELIYLFVHSVFHLLGHDHMSDDQKKIMRQAEEEVMSRLDLSRDQTE